MRLTVSNSVVIGGVHGQFIEVFKKISALHAKNAFALAIIVGDLFADPASAAAEDETNVDALVTGKIQIPLPTYFALGTHSLPPKVVEKLESSDGELCEHLFFLGKRAVLKTSEGIRLAALGGRLDPNLAVASSKDKYTPFYSIGDANSLRGANSVDILITSEWPENVRKGSKVDFASANTDDLASHRCVSELCNALKPRYFFTTSPNAFYEREPFFHAPSEPREDGYAITRFISLGSFGNTAKAKWIYAFSLDPTASAPVTIPGGTTASPISFTVPAGAAKRAAADSSFSRYDSNTHHSGGQRSSKRRRNNQGPPGPSECFFCLSNPNLAAHLVTSIGTDAYLTIAKGPLSTSSTFAASNITFPAHILIIPLPHAPTLSSIPDASSRTSTLAEMHRYRRSLQDMLLARGQGRLGAVTWEVSRAGGIHTHWQFLPVPVQLARKGLVEAGFKVEVENEAWPAAFAAGVGADETVEGEPGDFFRLWIWTPTMEGRVEAAVDAEDEGSRSTSEGTTRSMTLPLDSSFRFDLQFGRRVLAKLLGLEKRRDWRDCGQSEEEETADAEAFKEAFKAYDFSLED